MGGLLLATCIPEQGVAEKDLVLYRSRSSRELTLGRFVK